MEDKKSSDEQNSAFWKGVAAAFTAFIAIIAASKSL
jgi:hypothetical protein